jgi:hypothetical protein
LRAIRRPGGNDRDEEVNSMRDMITSLLRA